MDDHPTHIKLRRLRGHRRYAHRAQIAHQPTETVTADDLNRASARHHAFTNQAEERAYFGKVEHSGASTPKAAAEDKSSIGKITYSFTVGDRQIPHLYTADVKENGAVDGKAYRSDKDGKLVETTLPPHQVEMLQQFARDDVIKARRKNASSSPQIQSDLSYHQQQLMTAADAGWAASLFAKSSPGGMTPEYLKMALEHYPQQVLAEIQQDPRRARSYLTNAESVKIAKEYIANKEADPRLAKALGELMSETSPTSRPIAPARPGA